MHGVTMKLSRGLYSGVSETETHQCVSLYGQLKSLSSLVHALV